MEQNKREKDIKYLQPTFGTPLKVDNQILTNPQIINLWYKLLQEQGNIEIIEQNITTIKVKPKIDNKIEIINEELFLHILLEDSHKIAKKMEEEYKIDYTEDYQLDGILSKYNDDNENSAELIKSIRE
ncbi:MAG: hypothetical protein NWE89_05640 [Candidatus Bathyarchaeota archaeon]|nr:hypothetical protein [Candidatus Bathyarchaeota archaeon]